MSAKKDEIVPPGAAALIQAMRSIGYSTETSIADLLDNSITAGAKKIEIDFHWDGKDSYVTILDDGRGMDEPTLKDAMQFGGTSPLDKRDPTDLGRFGLGLKTASLSQAKVLTVATKQTKNGKLSMRCWDVDHVQKTNDWALQTQINEDKSVLGKLSANKSGTLVVWRKLDRLIGNSAPESDKAKTAFYAILASVHQHLEMVFHRFLAEGLAISMNERPCEPWDPFLAGHKNTEPQPAEDKDLGEAGILRIRPFVLPHSKYLGTKEHNRAAGPKGWNLQQGFYLYRAKRLIVVGGDWWNSGLKPEEHYKLGRIEVEITQQMDADWGLDVLKSKALPPTHLRDQFKRIAEAVRREAQTVYRRLGSRSPGTIKRQPVAMVWQEQISRRKAGYKINRKHPVIKEALDTEHDVADKPVGTILSLVEDHLPILTILSRGFNDENSFEEPPKEPTKEQQVLAKRFFEELCKAGYSPKEAQEHMATMEPFHRFPAMIGALEKDPPDV